MTKAKEVAPVDFGAFDGFLKAQEDGIEVAILKPDGKPMGFHVTVCGPDSDRMQKAMADVQSASAKEAADKADMAEDTADAGDKRMIAILSKCILSWGPMDPIIDSKQLACTEENATILFTRYRFVRDQVEFKATRRSAFFVG